MKGNKGEIRAKFIAMTKDEGIKTNTGVKRNLKVQMHRVMVKNYFNMSLKSWILLENMVLTFPLLFWIEYTALKEFF